MKNIYNLNQGDGLFCTSDIGWVMGHSFITYAPLLRAVRSVLFEGKPVGTPDAGIYWRIVQKCKSTYP
jgi:propionyl-CoA synthetase